jgi:acetylornithine/succinyldiaminopimelate/putrescine aminotransferase
MVHYLAEMLRDGLEQIREDNPDWFVGIRQDGLVIGLEFDHPRGAMIVSRHLYDHGVWAIFSTLDPRVLQFKPGLLLTPDLAEELLDRLAVAVARARQDHEAGRAA